jgi:hypothetical protein
MPSITNPEEEEIVDVPENDGNASVPEQVKNLIHGRRRRRRRRRGRRRKEEEDGGDDDDDDDKRGMLQFTNKIRLVVSSYTHQLKPIIL